tara:strand:- start:1103 stop:1369 length:267 start_codon:yes stop_codon:yes gene_type:complete
MSPTDVLDVGQDAIFVLLKVGTPLMFAALLTGLAISFFQALTQIQEMTLSFIPKILVTFGGMILLMPFFGRTLGAFSQEIFNRIIGLG